MFTGVSASTEGTPAAPTAGQLMQLIPAELQQQAKAGADLTDEQGLDTGGLTLEWGDHDGPNYILKLSAPAQGTAQGKTSAKYGVFDFAAGKWRIPASTTAFTASRNTAISWSCRTATGQSATKRKPTAL